MRVVRTGVISDWKGCATAHCAMMAVFAARWAKEGLTGPCEPFEGIAGFYEFLNVGPFNLEGVGLPRNGLSAIEATGFKYYPAEYSSQGPLGVVLELRKRINIEEIEEVNIALHWGAGTKSEAARATGKTSGTRRRARRLTIAYPTSSRLRSWTDRLRREASPTNGYSIPSCGR